MLCPMIFRYEALKCRMIGFIAQSALGLRSRFSDVWKNNLQFASPSIRRPTLRSWEKTGTAIPRLTWKQRSCG